MLLYAFCLAVASIHLFYRGTYCMINVMCEKRASIPLDIEEVKMKVA